jgi:pimeloyl-ACP methyl ester carboxylesterase
MRRLLTLLLVSLTTLGLLLPAAGAPAAKKRPRLDVLLGQAARARGPERDQALGAIRDQGSAVVSPLFERLAKGPDEERLAAAEALGVIGQGESREFVARESERRFRELQRRPVPANGDLRRLLLIVYARSRGPAGVALVCDGLHDEALRATAAAELVRMGPPAARELVITAAERPQVVQAAAIEVLKTMPEAAAPLVVPLFRRPTDEASAFAGMLLAELRDPRIVPDLVAMVREQTAHDEADVLRALSIYGDLPEVRQTLAGALGSPFPYLRFAAVEVVRGWRDDAGVLPLRPALLALARRDHAEDVQAGAVRTLLAHWTPEAVDTLLEVLEDETVEPRARVAAADALGFLGTGAHVTAVARALDDAPACPGLEPAVRAALRRLTYRPAASTEDEFRAPLAVADALGDPLELEPLADAPAGAPPAWTNDEDGPLVFVLGGLPDRGPASLAVWLGDVVEDYRVVAVAPPVPAAGADGGWEQTLDRGLEALRAHFSAEKATLVGHGFGALLALRYATRHPDRAERLVLVGMPQPHRAAWDEWATAAVRRLPAQAITDLGVLRAGWSGEAPRSADRGAWRVLAPALFHVAESAALVRDRPAPGDLGAAWLAALGPFDQRPDLLALAVPTLLVVGLADPLPEEQRALWRQRHDESGGRFRFVLLAGAGHYPFLEQPQAFRAELAAWLPPVE